MSDDFPAFGKPTRPDVGDALQDQPKHAALARCPGLALRGARLVEVLKCVLPQPPLPPLQSTMRCPSSTTSATTCAVASSMTTVPSGSFSTAVRPVARRAVLALAVLAAPGPPVRLEPEVDEVVRVVVADQDDVAAVAAVAAVGPAPRLVFLAAEADAAAPAVTGFGLDHALVDKHGSTLQNPGPLPSGPCINRWPPSGPPPRRPPYTVTLIPLRR